MELHRLTRHCYYSDPIQEGDQPVMGLIAGACETLAVDTGNGPGRGLWLLQQAEKLGLPPVRWVVLTHWHCRENGPQYMYPRNYRFSGTAYQTIPAGQILSSAPKPVLLSYP